jgi:hypothetical protein
MPLLIDSAPDCVTHGEHYSAKDIADFILNDNYTDCASIGTFMPGSTYGDDGTGAETLYMIVTWVGIAVMVAVLVAWVLYENRRLVLAAAGFTQAETPATGPPAQSGGVGDTR